MLVPGPVKLIRDGAGAGSDRADSCRRDRSRRSGRACRRIWSDQLLRNDVKNRVHLLIEQFGVVSWSVEDIIPNQVVPSCISQFPGGAKCGLYGGVFNRGVDVCERVSRNIYGAFVTEIIFKRTHRQDVSQCVLPA